MDALLARINARPQGTNELDPIPWPNGLAPTPSKSLRHMTGASMPKADVLVVTWTTAEGEALADVLTPGVHRTSWIPYTKNWPEFESQLTGRSPARESRMLASYWVTRIGDVTVVVAKSELHLATDGDTAPIVQLWQQMIGDVEPSLVITTGTAGGIGSTVVLGDVSIAAAAQFNCTKAFKAKSWAAARYVSRWSFPSSLANLAIAQHKLIPVNAAHLKPVATREPVVYSSGDVETIDFFGFDDTSDSYGIRADDSQARMEEMDDATLPLALQDLGNDPVWLSVRNASDPEVPSSIGTLEQQSKWASHIYEKYGYFTSVGSAITCWALIADTLAAKPAAA